MIYTKESHKKTKNTPEKRYEKSWLEENELQQILDADISEKYSIWVMIMYYGGLRVTEATQMKYKHIDMENRCIEIWGGKKRADTEMEKVPYKKDILKQIKRYCEHSNLRPNDYIMFSQKSPQVSRSQVYRVFNKICKDLNLNKSIATHGFRRTRSNYLLNHGMSITTLSKFLRHKNIATTMKYLNIGFQDVQKELDAIEM